MELKDLKSLIKLVTDTDITEFNMESAVGKIHIKRGPDKEIVYASAPVAAAPALAAPASATAPAATPAGGKDLNSKYEAIPSPIVGTFYPNRHRKLMPSVKSVTSSRPARLFVWLRR